ncbi:MAG: OsmC family protein [Flavobacterium sp.]|nr:OsmC family protein [Candidatus Neoflavobacterium equi]
MTDVKASIGNNKYKTTLQAGDLIAYADEPADLGGTNTAMNPKELLAASLASCTAITVRMYANTKAWPLEDVIVNVSIDTETTPGKTVFKKDIELIGPLDDKQKERLLGVASKCPVHKILTNSIEIN